MVVSDHYFHTCRPSPVSSLFKISHIKTISSENSDRYWRDFESGWGDLDDNYLSCAILCHIQIFFAVKSTFILFHRNCTMSTGNEWHDSFCPSSYSWLLVLGLCLYLFCFAPGMGPLPWTVNAEIYPTWSRSLCSGLATSVNWISNLLVSVTFLTIIETFGKQCFFVM